MVGGECCIRLHIHSLRNLSECHTSIVSQANNLQVSFLSSGPVGCTKPFRISRLHRRGRFTHRTANLFPCESLLSQPLDCLSPLPAPIKWCMDFDRVARINGFNQVWLADPTGSEEGVRLVEVRHLIRWSLGVFSWPETTTIPNSRNGYCWPLQPWLSSSLRHTGITLPWYEFHHRFA